MSHRRRQRLWIALFALVGLLFQQLALAGHLCVPVERAAAHAVDACAGDATAVEAATCVQHCAQVTPSPDHASVPAVPVLVPMVPALEGTDLARDCIDAAAPKLAKSSAPPLRIRDSSFQI